MKLCNRLPNPYTAPMISSRSCPLIAQLRASTRLVAWVLLMFVVNIGVVAACTVHDLEDLSQTGKATTTLSVSGAEVSQDTGTDDPIGSNQHRGCTDCSCHHATALLPEPLSMTYPPGRSEPTHAYLHAHQSAPRRELRPPIV